MLVLVYCQVFIRKNNRMKTGSIERRNSMKRLGILLILGILLVLIAGCRRTADEDIYDAPEVTEMSIDQEGTSEASFPDSGQKADGTVQGTTESGLPDEDGSNDATVSEDVYDNKNATEAVDHDTVEVVAVPESIEDPEFQSSLLAFLDPVFYNVFFGYGDYTEGITEDDMIKFAVSYVYQHEYNELKFDTTEFILYVPEKRVEELVVKFFDAPVTRHHSFEEDRLMYEDGFYLMPAVDAGWGETLSIEKVTPTGDFSYDVLMELISEEEQTSSYYVASIEMRDGRFVLTAYVSAEEGASTTEETAE